MTVNYEFAEVLVAIEEFVPDPQHVILLLLFEGDPRSHAGVDEKEITANK